MEVGVVAVVVDSVVNGEKDVEEVGVEDGIVEVFEVGVGVGGKVGGKDGAVDG